MTAAAASLVRRGRLVLTVWNRRFNGYALPGGKREGDETLLEAQIRELREETGVHTVSSRLIYQEMHNEVSVHVFEVEIAGMPRETEEGCPVKWMTVDELCRSSPFASFYWRMFAAEATRAP